MTHQGIKFEKDFELYNKSAGQYDEIRFSGLAGAWSHRRQTEVLLKLIPDIQGKKVLEIGAGTGRVTRCLVEAGAHVVATDISPEMLAVAKDRISDAALTHMTEFKLFNIFEPFIEHGEYDYIVALNVLSRLSNPQLAIMNVSKSMSSKCQFIFSFNNLSSVLMPFGLLVNALGKSLSRDVTSRWYTSAQIERFCDNASLDIHDWGGNHYVPSPQFLYFTLPLFRFFDRLISTRFPQWSPSVFAVTQKSSRMVSDSS